jgi:hypothetical protein
LPKSGNRDLAKEKYWRKALERYAASGKSRAQFCANEDLPVHAFYYWSRAILERDAERTKTGPPMQPNAAQFVPVVLPVDQQHPIEARRQPAAEIVFAGGSVFIYSGIQSSTLREVFRALREVAI